MLSRLRALRDGQRDAGFTLVELLVGMGLVTILGAISLQFFVSNVEQSNRVSDQAIDGGDVRVAAEAVAGELRLMDSPRARPGTVGRLETMQPDHIVFYANVDTGSRVGTMSRTPPTRIDISVSNGQLIERRYAPKIRYASVAASPAPTTTPTPYPTKADGSDNYVYASNYPSATPSDGASGDQPTSRRVLLSGIVVPDLSTTPVTNPVFQFCTAATDPSVQCTPATDVSSVASIWVGLTVTARSGNASQTLQTIVALNGVGS